jgi:uncharacterized membrane protein YgcG
VKRHLIWIIAGTAAIGLAVPAFAAVGPSATPNDDGTPGEVRGNCDEAEHAGDPDCLTVNVQAPAAAVTPATAATVQVTVPSTSVPSNTTPATVPANTVANTVPDNTTRDNGTVGTAPTNTVNSVPGDISGPCDEAEHANDPRCTGAAPSDDSSGHNSGDDDSGHHSGGDDDSGHHGGGDDSSGHGSDDD